MESRRVSGRHGAQSGGLLKSTVGTVPGLSTLAESTVQRPSGADQCVLYGHRHVAGWSGRPNEWAVTCKLNEYSSQGNEKKIVDTLSPRSRAATLAVYAGRNRNG